MLGFGFNVFQNCFVLYVWARFLYLTMQIRFCFVGLNLIKIYISIAIYPPELEVKETIDTASSASFLDLYLEFDDSGQLSIKIYDKRDDFNFKIINFPNMCSNIPASPAYGVYISQLNRYARASSNYSDFLKRHLHLRNRLLDQGY